MSGMYILVIHIYDSCFLLDMKLVACCLPAMYFHAFFVLSSLAILFMSLMLLLAFKEMSLEIQLTSVMAVREFAIAHRISLVGAMSSARPLVAFNLLLAFSWLPPPSPPLCGVVVPVLTPLHER